MTPSAANALLAESLFLIAVAPVAGVALQSRRRLAAVITAPAIIGAAFITLTAQFAGGVVLSQAIVLAAACALAAIGRLCRTTFSDRLDAAACSLAIALALTFGLLAAGPAAGDLPTSLLNLALALNPVIAATSAAGVDLLRSRPLYEWSPIAHRLFAYPSWWFSLVMFAATAVVCVTLEFFLPVKAVRI